MFSLTKVRNRVYSLRVDSTYDLAMMCLRVSEMIECPNPHFHKPFTIVEYMSWYAKTQSSCKAFSYPEDWGGWNIRVDDIKKIHDAGIPDPNHYDGFMLGIYGLITAETTEPSYIIALPTTMTEDSTLEQHELTHAMYYIDDAYTQGCKDLLIKYDELNPDLVKVMRETIKTAGYSERACDDEIQAYISTGEAGYFDKITDPMLDEFRKEQKALHDKHYTEFMGIKKKKVHIFPL